METFDRSFYEFGEGELKEMWEPDFDSPMQDAFGCDASDWTTLLDHQLVILNDRMMTDALQSPRITSEHSYSLVTNDELADSSLDESRLDLDQDLESDCFPAIPMTTNTGGHSEIFIKQEPLSAPNSPEPSPSPSPSPFQKTNISTTAAMTSTCSQSLLKQPTIILATRPSSQRCMFLPKVNVKMETQTSSFSLPPTPPSSTSSDSEGSLSPVHSQQPSSPSAVTMSPGSNNTMPTRRPSSLGNTGRCHTNTPLISSQPKGATGVLMLTEEEKRTLLAEGYPIPSKLPLTKAEEKSLKKIRRKIKNKISAQESRRKKKEYMDSLEKRVEALHSENNEYKRKVDSLENSNKSLLSQLHKLQQLVGELPNRIARNASTQTTSLMVLVVCFALSFGLWGTSLSLTSSSLPALQPNLHDQKIPSGKFMPCQDPYSTLNRRSRFLLAFLDENEQGNDDEITCKDVQCLNDDISHFGTVSDDSAVHDALLSSELTKEMDDDTLSFSEFISDPNRKDNIHVLAGSTLKRILNTNVEIVLNAPNNASVKQTVPNTVA